MPEPQLTYYPLGEGVTAFSTTRHGGFSRGNYGAFNVNRYCGDAPEAIRQNRRLLSLKLGVTDDRIVMPHQVHGVQIRKITLGFLYASADEQKARLEGRTTVKRRPGHINPSGIQSEMGFCISVHTVSSTSLTTSGLTTGSGSTSGLTRPRASKNSGEPIEARNSL